MAQAAPAKEKPIAAAAPAAKAAPKKGAMKKAAKAPAKAAKAPAKAAKPVITKKAPAKVKDPNEVFRAGSTKAGIFNLLKDGKLHTREQIYGYIEKAGKTRQLLHWVLDVLPKKGWKIVQNDPEGVQIAKK